jgi:hypothetical protein
MTLGNMRELGVQRLVAQIHRQGGVRCPQSSGLNHQPQQEEQCVRNNYWH